MRETAGQADKLRSSLSKAFAVVGVGLLIRQTIQLTDAYTGLQNKLRTVIDDQETLNQTFEDLNGIANRTRTEVDSVVTLYQRGSIAAKELGISNEELLKFVERVGQGLAVQGGAASSASGALIQLSQALGAGIVRAEEFNAILEGAFPIAQAAAKGIAEAGGSVARLRQLIIAGEVTSSQFFQGFLKGSDELEEKFGRTTSTIGQAFTVFKNNITRFIGELNYGTGVSANFADGIILVSENVETLARVLVTVLVAKGIGAVLSGLKALKVALLTNPITLLPSIVALGIGALVAFGDELKVTSDGLATVADVAAEFWDDLKLLAADVVPAVTEAFSGLVPEVDVSLRGLLTAVAVTLDAIIGLFKGAFNAVVVVWGALSTRFDDVLNPVVKAVRDTLETIVDVTLATFQTVGDVVLGVVNDIGIALKASALSLRFAIEGELELAANQAETAENAIGLVTQRLKGIPETFESNRKALANTELLPVIELTQGAKDLGSRVAEEFQRGFEESAGVTDYVDGLFDRAEGRAGARAASLATTGGEAAPAGGTGTVDASGIEDATKLTQEQAKLLAEIQGPALQHEQTLRTLNELYAMGKIDLEEYNAKLVESKIAANEADTSISGGFASGLAKIQSEIQDVGQAVDDTLVNAFHSAEDALVSFVRTGEFNFKQFANSLLDQITRLIIKLLILETFQAITGTGGSSGAKPKAKAAGGPVEANKPYLVGEEGPELFTPQNMGSVLPASETAQQLAAAGKGGTTVVQSPPPKVSVNVVNVSDPNEVPKAMDSPAGDQTILNSVTRNKDQLKRILQS